MASMRRPGALLLVLCATAAMCRVAVAEDEATLVGVDNVVSEELAQSVPVVGRLVSRRSGMVAARVQGPLEQVRVEVGDRVEQGSVIAVLNLDRLIAERDLRAAEVKRAEADVAASEARIRLRRQELARLEGLRTSPAFSKGNYEDKGQELSISVGEAARADAALASSRAQLRLAEIAVRDAEIRAPYSGVVTRRHAEVGDYLDVGDPVVSLLDDNQLEIEADVPAERVSGLIPGTALDVDVAGNRIQAVVRAVVPEENPLTRTRTVRFTFRSADFGPLAASQSLTVHVPLGVPRTMVTVHKDAVLVRKGQPEVVLVVDGTAEIRSIRIGEAVGGRFEAIEGLEPGEIVVIRGNERLRTGQKVRYQTSTEG